MPEGVDAETNTTKAITKQTANVFTGILLALILETSLDVSCKNISNYASVGELYRTLANHLEWFTVVFLQWFVFVVTLTRFYWGTVRYHEQVPDDGGTRHLLCGLAGAVFVFSAFYLTALVVRTPGLFYASFCLAFAVDLVWFFIADKLGTISEDIENLWNWYKFFDVITIVSLLVLIAIASTFQSAARLCNVVSLVVVFGIGVWDVWAFWSYYAQEDNWPEKVPQFGLRRRRS